MSMAFSKPRWIMIAGVALGLGGCGDPATSDNGDDVPASDVDDTGGGNTDVAPTVCNEGTVWEPGIDAYEQATEAWGLTGIQGIRFNVTDFDGDGWPDLLVRNGGGPDDFSEGGNRSRWLLRNRQDGTFEDVTQASDLLVGRYGDPDFGRPGEVMATGDVNNDGHLDIYIARSVSEPDQVREISEMMINSGQGTFFFGPSETDARFEGEQAVPAGVAFIDYDRDGNLDLWTTHNMAGGETMPLQDRLFRGDGEGGFTDVTVEAGLTTVGWNDVDELNQALGHSWAWSATACDLNDDGTPELLAASYGRVPNHLWQGVRTGDGVTFVNQSVASGYAYDHRDDWGDNINAQCHCFDNPDHTECELAGTPGIDCQAWWDGWGGFYRWDHVSDREAWRLGGNSAATTCADIDNDGDMDLMTGEIVHWDVGDSSDPAELLINQSDGDIGVDVRFERPGNEVTGIVRVDPGMAWDHGDMSNTVFDFDNDGWLDVYIGASDYLDNEALLFHQTSPLQFTRLETTEFFDHNRAHGVVHGDFDRDGDLDVVAGHSLMRCDGTLGVDCYEDQQIHFYENVLSDNLGREANWLQLRLEGGAGTNRAAIGARVRVTAGGVTQTQFVDGGHGHFGTQHDLTLHFGLGASCDAEVTVTWPDRSLTEQTVSLSANRRYHLMEGGDAVVLQ
jgi:hypothetical protein